MSARTLPRVTQLRRDGTHRLIPAKYIERDESVLTRLVDKDKDAAADLHALYELEGATNDRLLGEAGALPGVGVRELVFGVPHAHIINAAFTHASPLGNRFNGPDRGAWYASFARRTSELEVAYHRAKELAEVNWQEKETFAYVDFLADFRGEFYDIRDDARFAACWEGDSYAASQRLAEDLLERARQARHLPRLLPPRPRHPRPQSRKNLHHLQIRHRPARIPRATIEFTAR
jgi:hypothetical protein